MFLRLLDTLSFVWVILVLLKISESLFIISFMIISVISVSFLEKLSEFQKYFGKTKFITVNKEILIMFSPLIVGLPFLLYSFDITVLLFVLASLCNALPITFNQGLMPCLPSAYVKCHGRLLETDSDGKIQDPINRRYCYIGPKTKLAFLSDNFYYLGGVLSIGDILLLMALISGITHQIMQLFT